MHCTVPRLTIKLIFNQCCTHISCASGIYPHMLKDGKYVMPDGTLSGSSLSMLQAVYNGNLYSIFRLLIIYSIRVF